MRECRRFAERTSLTDFCWSHGAFSEQALATESSAPCWLTALQPALLATFNVFLPISNNFRYRVILMNTMRKARKIIPNVHTLLSLTVLYSRQCSVTSQVINELQGSQTTSSVSVLSVNDVN